MTSALLLLEDGAVRAVDPATPIVRADDLGLLRGESVFETARIASSRAVVVQEHLARLARSAARLGIAVPPGIEQLTQAAVAAWTQPDGVLRLVLTKGGTCFALVTEVPEETVRAREHGVSVVTLTLGVSAAERARSPWLLGGVKATSYAVNMATLRQAHDEGADDAIWLSSDGQVLEAPTATVVVVCDGVLATPPPEVGILPGTTVEAVLGLRLVPAEVRPVSAAELAGADEVALLSSIRGVAPVVRLDGRELGTGPVTARLRAAFEAGL